MVNRMFSDRDPHYLPSQIQWECGSLVSQLCGISVLRLLSDAPYLLVVLLGEGFHPFSHGGLSNQWSVAIFPFSPSHLLQIQTDKSNLM